MVALLFGDSRVVAAIVGVGRGAGAPCPLLFIFHKMYTFVLSEALCLFSGAWRCCLMIQCGCCYDMAFTTTNIIGVGWGGGALPVSYIFFHKDGYYICFKPENNTQTEALCLFSEGGGGGARSREEGGCRARGLTAPRTVP